MSPTHHGGQSGSPLDAQLRPALDPPHEDVILPADIQGMPALGLSDATDPLVEVINRKLTLMRRKHAQKRHQPPPQLTQAWICKLARISRRRGQSASWNS
jgi:hypothetical protein